MTLSPKEAYVIFKKKHPEYEVNKMALYRDQYMISVKQNPAEYDYGIPIYCIGKRNGNISTIVPTSDIVGIVKSFESNTVSFK